MIQRLFITAIVFLLAGCDIPGMGPDPRVAQREAEAHAIGSACRYGLRGIENCYELYEDASKAAIFSGWKEMDEYMRENKIVGIRAAAGPAEREEVLIEDKKLKADTQEKASNAKAEQTAAAVAAR